MLKILNLSNILLISSSFLILALELGCKGDIDGPSPPGPPWVVFTNANSPLPSNEVNSVFVDREIRVWFATTGGAASFKDKSWGVFKDSLRYYVYDNGGNPIPNYNVTSITEGKDRSMWFGLLGGGASRYNQYSQNGNIWTRYNSASPGLFSNNILSLTADISDATVNGEMWFVCSGGLNRLIQNSTNGGTWVDYSVPAGPTYTTTNPYDNTIWIGSFSAGLEQFTYGQNPPFAHVPIPSGYVGKVHGIAFDGSNNVWVAKDIGVSVLNLISGLWKHYSHSNTSGNLPPGDVYGIETDQGLNRWFGTDSGLVHLSDTTWTRFTTANSPLPGNTVTSVKYDARGNLWIGTKSGVAAYNPEGTRF